MRREIARKVIHVGSALVPLVFWFLPRPAGVALLALGVAAALAMEWARARLAWVRLVFLRGTRTMLRSRERSSLAGATYMAIAYLVAGALFPKPIAVIAMLYVALGDATSALVGTRWGRHRTSWGKSWEGFSAGLTVDLALGMAVPGLGIQAAIAGAVTAAVLEFVPLPVDDNIRICLGGGAAAWAVALLVAPLPAA